MRRATGIFVCLALGACGAGAETYETPHDLGVALTRGGVHCEIPEEDTFDPDDYPYMPEAQKKIFEAAEAYEDEYDMTTGLCELSPEESAVVLVFETDADRDRMLNEERDEEHVYVVGPQWVVSVESIPTAEKVQDVIGGDVQE